MLKRVNMVIKAEKDWKYIKNQKEQKSLISKIISAFFSGKLQQVELEKFEWRMTVKSIVIFKLLTLYERTGTIHELSLRLLLNRKNKITRIDL